MPVEAIPDFGEFLAQGLWRLPLVLLACAVVGLVGGYIVAAFRHGPVEAFYTVATVIAGSFPDWLRLSPRRIWAMARLAIKEALRRRVLMVAFVIFMLALLFGGWFIDRGVEHPDRIFVDTVFFGAQVLVLLLVLLVSAFSLPEDIKNRTIFTVVTKPVRPSEILLGRILGFTIVGTVMLAAMGLLSLLFVWRGLSHEHTLEANPEKPSAAVGTVASFNDVFATGITKDNRRVSELALKELLTSRDSDHRHQLEYIRKVLPNEWAQPPGVVKKEPVDENFTAYYLVVCQPTAGHTHPVSVEGTGDDATVKLGPAVGYFRARVPIYCDQLVFFGREGTLKGKVFRSGEREGKAGINVGKMWQYRGYVEGGNSLSKAQFDFSSFDESKFSRSIVSPDRTDAYVPIEMTLSAYRSYKGNITRRLRAQLTIESIGDSDEGSPVFQSDALEFETNEFYLQTVRIPRRLPGRLLDGAGNTEKIGVFDLFDDYARDGKLRVVIRCSDAQQLIGVGLGDVYFRASDQPYWWNFVKGFYGVWLQMVVVITIAVALSTFLSMPLTMIGTLGMAIIGLATPFIQKLTAEDSEGGGPIESLIRMVTQTNMVTSFDEEAFWTTVMKQVDALLVAGMTSLTQVIPNLSSLDLTRFVRYGYAIESDRLLISTTSALAFCAGMIVFGYFCLKTREVAA